MVQLLSFFSEPTVFLNNLTHPKIQDIAKYVNLLLNWVTVAMMIVLTKRFEPINVDCCWQIEITSLDYVFTII